jgi:hypothetical protein
MITNPPNEPSSPLPTPGALADLYLQLATAAGGQDQRSAEVRFYVLAAGAAEQGGFVSVAEGCRQRILEQNPDHPARRFKSMGEALSHPDFAAYVRDLQEAYPPTKGEYLLERYRAAGYDGEHPFRDSLRSFRWPVKRRALAVPGSRKRPDAGMPAEVLFDRSEASRAELTLPSFEPLPFEWPTASRPPTLKISPVWAASVGVLAGLILGLWLSPRVGPWADQIRLWWESAGRP